MDVQTQTQTIAQANVANGRPKVRITLVEKNGKAFLRIEYSDYTPIAQKLEARGLRRYRSYRIFGDMEGEAYRYLTNDYIVPEKYTKVKLANDFELEIKTIDDINSPAVTYTEYDGLIINFAIFRVVPRREGDIYVTEAPINAQFIPCFRKVFYTVVKLWKLYLEYLLPVNKVKLNVEFW